MTVLVTHPVFQAVGLVMASACYLTQKGRGGWKLILVLIPVILVLAAINPLFNTRGDTVLFVWMASRPYTLEALIYGLSMGLMFAAILLWFFSFNVIMTSDRLTYLFGGLAPAITLVLTMVLRLIPTYQRKAKELSTARTAIGNAPSQGTLKERVVTGTGLLSALVSWALEGSVIMADSMRSRGYGVGRRTTFAHYRFTARDAVALVVLVALGAVALYAILAGAEAMEYFPAIVFPALSPLGVCGLLCFIGYLAVPSAIDLWEAVSWRISLSRI